MEFMSTFMKKRDGLGNMEDGDDESGEPSEYLQDESDGENQEGIAGTRSSASAVPPKSIRAVEKTKKPRNGVSGTFMSTMSKLGSLITEKISAEDEFGKNMVYRIRRLPENQRKSASTESLTS